MIDPNTNEPLLEPEADDQPGAVDQLIEVAQADEKSPKAAADEAKPLAMIWLDNALAMLRASIRSFEYDVPRETRLGPGLEAVRRHFHTDRRKVVLSESAAIKLVEQNFQTMRAVLSTSDSIFLSVDDETAYNNTRGHFSSGLLVAAYAYAQRSISFTSHFPTLGPRCKAAVIIHQLAHFIDARMLDHSCGGLIYDSADFETSLLNVHCYPNFAVNATPPYFDERYGLTRPEF